MFTAITFYFSSHYFRQSVAVFADFVIFYGIKFMVLNMPLIFIFLVVFVIFLMDLTLINTFLVLCPSVSYRIKILYGENFLKQRFYNSSLVSVKAASLMSKSVAVGVLGGIVGRTMTNIFGEYMYSLNYNKLIEAKLNNPGLDVSPPKKSIFGFNIGH